MKYYRCLKLLFAGIVLLVLSAPGFAAKAKKVAPIAVEVAKVKQMDIPKYIFSVGSLVAIQSVTISSEVDGRIEKVYFKDGQDVKKGDALIQLDAAQDKADLLAKQTALKLSKATYERYLYLFKTDGGVSKQNIDQKRSDMESKRADVKAAIASLQEKTLLTPFTGRLGQFKVTEGNYIQKGQALVSVVNKRTLKVEYNLPGSALPKLKLRQVVQVNLKSFPGVVFDGQVSFIAPQVDVTTRTVTVEATIPNPDEKLSPGMFVHVRQTINVVKNALVIPEEAITASLQGDYVYKVVNNKAVKTKVKVQQRLQGLAHIVSGLTLNDTVVVAGQQKLKDGKTVTIVNNMPKA